VKCKYQLVSTPTGKELIIDLESCKILPTLEDNPECMRKVIEILLKVGKIDSLSLVYNLEYNYPKDQTDILNDYRLALIDIYFKEKIEEELDRISKEPIYLKYHAPTIVTLKHVVKDLLLEDPIEAYLEARKAYFIEKAKKPVDEENKRTKTKILLLLGNLIKKLEETKIIKKFEGRFREYTERNFYREIFRPIIRPAFIKTRLYTTGPPDSVEIESYFKLGRKISIFKKKNESRFYYLITPPEYFLKKDEMDILISVRDILGKLTPEETPFIRTRKVREIVKGMAIDLINKEAKEKGLDLSGEDIEKLAEILTKITVGFGILEDIVADDKIEDVYINSPIGEIPIIVKHSDYGEMITNILPNEEEVRSWISKIRLLSGRPLDEAHPVLDYDLTLPTARTRVAIVQQPFSMKGYAIAIRRHRARPWTLPLFIKNGMISSLGAALLWFLVDGGRTILIAGTRGAGKTSLLMSLILQISRRYRIITIEDTPELPVDYYRKLGYNILPLKVRSATAIESAELTAEQGIRTSLRLGDSCLIIGEVRGKEARSLYEAMRVGAMANVVAGTIHGDSPYSVFDRVVNDIGIPPTSFKATDIIVIANKIRTPGGLREVRRVVEISEIRKHWEKDPLLERGFITLMRYDGKKDLLVPTPELIEGDSEILKSIASRVREFIGRWEKIWENILLRKEVLETIISISNNAGNPEILEAECIVASNDIFANAVDKIKDELGDLIKEEIYKEWKDNFTKYLKEKGYI